MNYQLILAIITAAVFLLGIVLILWLRGLHDFRIVLTERGIEFTGQFPARHRADVADFLRQNISGRPALILGRWQAGRVLRLQFRGAIDPAIQQRIRNFLIVTIKTPR
jgi:hypothetical protein